MSPPVFHHTAKTPNFPSKPVVFGNRAVSDDFRLLKGGFWEKSARAYPPAKIRRKTLSAEGGAHGRTRMVLLYDKTEHRENAPLSVGFGPRDVPPRHGCRRFWTKCKGRGGLKALSTSLPSSRSLLVTTTCARCDQSSTSAGSTAANHAANVIKKNTGAANKMRTPSKKWR